MKLITDRTHSDVLLGTQKGFYTAIDLNRVEQAVSELAALAEKLDIHITPQVKTDWSSPGAFSTDSWPVRSQMQRYLNNVRMVCSSVGITSQLPASMEKLDWKNANRIENALELAEGELHRVIHTFWYSGELFAGEECGL